MSVTSSAHQLCIVYKECLARSCPSIYGALLALLAQRPQLLVDDTQIAFCVAGLPL